MDIPTLETQRLLLRPPNFGDADVIAKMHQDPQLVKHLLSPCVDLAAATAEVEAAYQLWKRVQLTWWSAELKDTGVLVGRVALHPADGHDAELGCILGRPYWNTGLGKEAAQGVLHYAFHVRNMSSVVSHVHPDNLAAQRQLVALGFKRHRSIRNRRQAAWVYVLER